MRVPLAIDPNKFFEGWLPSLLNGLVVVSADNENKMLLKLQGALAYGKPILITDIKETIPALLVPLVEALGNNGGPLKRTNILLGDNVQYPYNPEFKLFLSTGCPEPAVDVYGQCEIVDFKFKGTGYIEQHMVGRLMTKDCPETKGEIVKLLEMAKAATGDLHRNINHLQGVVVEKQESATDEDSKFPLEKAKAVTDLLGAVKRAWNEHNDKQATLKDSRSRLHASFKEFENVGTRCGVLWDVLQTVAEFEPACNVTYKRFVTLFDAAATKVPKGALPTRRAAEMEEALTHVVLTSYFRTLPDESRLLVAFMYSTRLEMQQASDIVQYMGCLRGAPFYTNISTPISSSGNTTTPRNNDDDEKGNPCSGWLPEASWNTVQTLAQNIDTFRSLGDSFNKKEKAWRTWWQQWRADQKLPDYEKLSKLEKLMLCRYLREDRSHAATVYFSRQVLGDKIQGFEHETIKDLIKSVVGEGSPSMPTVFVLPSGVDVFEELSNFVKSGKGAKKKAGAEGGVVAVNLLVKGQTKADAQANAMTQFEQCRTNGGYLVVRDVAAHADEWFQQVVDKLHSAEEPHADFHMFVTTSDPNLLPAVLLDTSVVVATPVPKGIKNRLLSQYGCLNQKTMDTLGTAEWRHAAFGMNLLNSLVQERSHCGALGVSGFNTNLKSEGGFDDSEAFKDFMLWSIAKYKKETNNKPPAVPWPTLKYMASQVFLGGAVQNEVGRQLLDAYAEYFVTPDVLKAGMHVCHGYSVPTQDDYNGHTQHIGGYPQTDKAETIGLHGNSDLVISDNKSSGVYSKVLAAHLSSHVFCYNFHKGLLAQKISYTDTVTKTAESLLAMIPTLYSPAEIESKTLATFGDSPIGVFIKEEFDFLQRIAVKVREQLKDLVNSLKKGWHNMAPELQKFADLLLLVITPPEWEKEGWGANTTVQWMEGLAERFNHLEAWFGAKPCTVWLGGFSNPQSFIVAMKQETVRAHPGEEEWSYEKLELKTEVTSELEVDIKRPPLEGVYIRGLQSYGFEFSQWDGKVFEPSDMLSEWNGSSTSPMPLLHFTVVQKEVLKKLTAATIFSCPVYTNPRRDNHVCDITMECDEHPLHWNLRSAAVYI
eukprot:TRINITY_DN52180_c0_g1_i1.p1 TRINITY_DN52180_c0_g1~~TRINITY_DN52180_c0_g1_i1.p1  ORF type:complete len:1162 (+),score=184.82 TRINITY_DN52180_c0_g1_i1:186-3488(+)